MTTLHSLVQVLWSICWGFLSHSHHYTPSNVNIQRGPHLAFRIWKKSVVQTELKLQHISVWNTEWGTTGQRPRTERLPLQKKPSSLCLSKILLKCWNTHKKLRERTKFKCFMKRGLCRKAGSLKTTCSLFISKWPAATGWPGTSCYLTSSATTPQ